MATLRRVTAPRTTHLRHWRTVDADTRVLLVTAAVVAVVLLLIASHPAGPAGPAWFAFPLLGIGSLCCWLLFAIRAVIHRRLSPGLIVAPLLGVLTAGLIYTSTPSRVRFILIDRPAFEQVVKHAPPPAITLPNRDLTDDEANDTYRDFPGPCPTFIGTLHIQECASFAAGYLFYDQAGSGLVDDGGLAYLPAGAPTHDVGNGAFESPEFMHLYGHWYAFASSW